MRKRILAPLLESRGEAVFLPNTAKVFAGRVGGEFPEASFWKQKTVLAHTTPSERSRWAGIVTGHPGCD